MQKKCRKADHLLLGKKARIPHDLVDSRFYFEPLLAEHPAGIPPIDFLGKKLNAPIWISSITGGTDKAQKINRNLAKVASKYGLGLGLGSCRPLLEGQDKYFEDFNLRHLLGDHLPMYANLGISQIESCLERKELAKVERLVDKLEADGLIIHVNPLQEWLQAEGNRIKRSPIETISSFLKKTKLKVIVKEVGQGFGPSSLRELLKLDLAAIEFGAFGGTNFTKLEMLRGGGRQEALSPLMLIGQTADEMVDIITNLKKDSSLEINCRQFIVSGGIKSFLDGFYLIEKLGKNSIYGQAYAFLEHAVNNYRDLDQYVSSQVEGLGLAFNYLKLRSKQGRKARNE